jgi:hypothetical protein
MSISIYPSSNNFSTSAELLVGANINTQTSADVATQTQYLMPSIQ